MYEKGNVVARPTAEIHRRGKSDEEKGIGNLIAFVHGSMTRSYPFYIPNLIIIIKHHK